MIRKRYRCPECHRVFEYDHHPSVEADPVSACPYRGCSAASDDMAPALVMPHIAKSIGRNTDDVYRQMEAGAEFRAQMAQEVHGLDASEANAMKITDTLDNRRPGEISAPPVNNDLSRQIESAPGQLGFVNGAAIAQGLQQSFVQGHHANAGLDAMIQLRAAHGRSAAGAIMRGTESGTPTLSSPPVVVDRPALETEMPGYRKRR